MTNYNWTCPECGEHIIEEVLPDVILYSDITDIEYDEDDDEIIVDYGATLTDGGDTGSIVYQCKSCGYKLSIDEMYGIGKSSKDDHACPISLPDIPALLHENGNDYILKDNQDSVWITVGNISVYIIRTDDGVVVDLLPKGKEIDKSLVTVRGYDEDALELINSD